MLPRASSPGRPADIRPNHRPEVRTGILLDTETTGLDQATDEIIELGMVRFDYEAEGRIAGVRRSWNVDHDSAPDLAEGCGPFVNATGKISAPEPPSGSAPRPGASR